MGRTGRTEMPARLAHLKDEERCRGSMLTKSSVRSRDGLPASPNSGVGRGDWRNCAPAELEKTDCTDVFFAYVAVNGRKRHLISVERTTFTRSLRRSRYSSR